MKIKLNYALFCIRRELLINMMRTFIFLCFTFAFSITPSNMLSQNAKIKIESNKTLTVDDVFDLIMQQTDYKFIYQEGIFKNFPKVEVKKGTIKANELIRKSLSNGNFEITVGKDNTVVVKEKIISTKPEQQHQIKGTVVDESGLPLPGANILEKDTTNGTQTDFDGNFSLEVSSENAIIVISYIGYESQQITVSNQSTFNIVLQPDLLGLNEIVVIGYGSMKKSDLTGAVSSVSGDDLLKVASNRPVEAIQGRVAGVSINKTSGRPGAGMKVRIRGVGSTNNSDPLYVVDGVPIGNDIEFLAPEDIQSIEILKDASSTAIYGNRGANGVIIVTTKSGKSSSKPVFSFNSYYGISEIPNKVELLDATQQAGLILEAAANDGQTLPSGLESRINYVLANNAKGTDWQSEVFREAHQQNYNLNIRGGISSDDDSGRKFLYALSGTLFDEDGTVKNTAFKKYIFNTKTEYYFNEKVNAGVQINIFRSELGNFPQSIFNGPIPLALTSSPIDSPRGVDGEFIPMLTAFGNNPSLLVDHLKYGNNKTNSYLLRTWLQFDILDGLNFKTNYQISNGAIHNKNYSPAYYLNENFNRAESQLYEQRGDFYSWTWVNLLNYNKTFNDVHKVIATLGHESSYNRSGGFSGVGINVPSEPDLQHLNLSKTFNERINAYQGQGGTESYFARAFYSFNNKYMFTGTARYDGSSKFSGDNKWGFFPSFGASWKADEESFIQDLNVFSALKFRVGWGRVGNESSAQAGSDVANIGNYSMQYVFNDVQYQGGTTTNIPTPDLKWEIIETQNFGVDMGFLDGDLTLTADYFIRDTKDMITRVALPGYFPKDRPNANIGTMSNKGFEFAANYGAKLGEVNFSVGANITFIDNEIVKLNSNDDAFIDGGFIDKLGFTTRTESGREIAYFYGYQTDGIFKTQEEVNAYASIQPDAKVGDVRFVDNSDNGTIDADDRVYLGSGQSDFSYGFNFNVEYKGFDLSGNFFGVQGAEIVNGLNVRLLGISDYYNSYADRVNRFHPINNPTGTQPRVTLSDANNNLRFSDRYVEDGSFLRLKNLQVGYTIPSKFTEKSGIEKLRLYVSGQNLLTFTKYKGYDPEVGDLTQGASNDVRSLGIGVDLGNYPQPRLFYLGVNLTF
ncbi:TonB-dependent receptor [uncultured Algibacter sp.]|uniref:SusC/RagA family TonB-linked outer membrane protein n=1 Tax=uncultured Algibacter sp. TaxID=298659 RepID=UPI002638A8A9|nr:TonB-dependent receptor [uncultured Algibacter sp.]